MWLCHIYVTPCGNAPNIVPRAAIEQTKHPVPQPSTANASSAAAMPRNILLDGYLMKKKKESSTKLLVSAAPIRRLALLRRVDLLTMASRLHCRAPSTKKGGSS